MELGNPLVDERLSFRAGGRDREVDFPHAGHPIRPVPRTIVERLAVKGMARCRHRGIGLGG
jgi:hypothetical protein